MASTYRRPVVEVSIDGQLAPRFTAVRVSKGMTQRYTTAEISFPWRYPEQLKQWSGIHVIGGGSSSGRAVHFAGNALDPSLALWTPRVRMLCGTVLARCESWYPPFSNTLNGLTDIEAIEFILDQVGITDRNIAGHGKYIGHLASGAMTWSPMQSALDMIEQIDTQVGLGYRTFDTGTTVVRQFIPLQPNEMTPVHTFNEGVDIVSATLNRTRIEPAGRVIVNGDGVSSDVTNDEPRDFPLTPYAVRWLMIQREAVDAGYVSTEEVALYLLAKLTRVLVGVSLTTHIDRVFAPAQVVKVVSQKLAVSQVFYVQQVVTSWDGAQFRQQLELISELDTRETPGGDEPIGIVDPIDKTPIDILPLPPIDYPIITPVIDVIAAITIVAIDKEKVVIAGTETEVYIVYAVDSSTVNQGTITARAWTASGPVLAGWETGTGLEFVTVFTSLTDAVITILVTASGGETGTVSRDVGASPGVVTKTLELFLAAGVNAEAWAPSENDWNVDPQSAAADVEDVANGPFWSLPVSANGGMYSTDYLATSATEVTIPFTDGSTAGVRSWIEPDVDDQLVGVIGTNGEAAFSTDRGATWSVKAGPGGAGRDIIISRFVPGQVHVLTATGYYVSDDYGNSWRLIVAGTTFKWLTLSHSRNVIVTNAGGIVTADENLTPFSGPSGVVTVAAHIREDRFVALTSAGNVWRTTTDGGTAMSDLGGITGTPVHSYRHGSIPDFYAYAAGTAGAFKLIIRTNAGPTYEVKTLQIRAPSVGNSAAASSYSRIGVGRMVDATAGAEPPPPVIGPDEAQYWLATGQGSFDRTYRYRRDNLWEVIGTGFGGQARASSHLIAAAQGETVGPPYHRTQNGWRGGHEEGAGDGRPSCLNGATWIYDPEYWLVDYGHTSICLQYGVNLSTNGSDYEPVGSPNRLKARNLAVDSSFIWGMGVQPGGFAVATTPKASPTIWTQVVASSAAWPNAIDVTIYAPQQAAGYCLIHLQELVAPARNTTTQRLIKVTTAGVITTVTVPGGFTQEKVWPGFWSHSFRSRDGVTWVGNITSHDNTQKLIIRSGDAGNTWSTVHTFPGSGTTGGEEPTYTTPEYSPTGAMRWFCHGKAIDGGIDVVVSDDDGLTWTSIGRPASVEIDETALGSCGVGL